MSRLEELIAELCPDGVEFYSLNKVTHYAKKRIDVSQVDKTTLTPKFLYYVLSPEDFFLYDIQNSKGAKMPRGDKEAVMNYRIPVPPCLYNLKSSASWTISRNS